MTMIKKKFTSIDDGINNMLDAAAYDYSKNGIKHKNTINILKPPKRIGGIVSFNPNLPVGYALPSRKTTNKISNVCFVDNYYLIEKGSKVGSSEV